MGLSGQLQGIVPAEVTYAQAAKVWGFGVACAEAAVEKGDGLLWDDPGQTTRENHLTMLRAWAPSFVSVPFGGGDVVMDRGNWDALRTQVFGAAADLESLGEVDDAFYRRLNLLASDLAEGTVQTLTSVANTVGDVAGSVVKGAASGLGTTGIVLLGVAGLVGYLVLKGKV